MQINNFKVAATPTSGNSNSHFDAGVAGVAGVAEGGFAALLRQQNLAASLTPVRAPAPGPAQFAVSAPPPAGPTPAPPPPPAPAPAPPTPATSTRTSQSTSVDKAPPPPPTSEQPSAPDAEHNARAAQLGKATRTSDKSGPAKASHASSATTDDLQFDKIKKAETTPGSDEDATPEPTPGQPLAAPHLPTEPAQTALRAAHWHPSRPGAGDPAAADDVPATSAKRGGLEHTARSDPLMKADTERSGMAARDQGERPGAVPASDFAGAFAELRPAMSPAARPAAAGDIDGSGTAVAVAVAVGAGAAFSLAPGTSLDGVPAQGLTLPTPVGAPDFAQNLGAQLSVLARDGVQHAELHLNPADMGPVSIHITMDGTQARVDFGADVAATRHAIEAGMPELAAALADAGFTLAGGGVSQHPRGRGEEGRGEPGSDRATRRVSAGSTGAAPASRMIRRMVSAGGVDLYA